MSYILIAAIGKNNELGKDNDLIWRFKGDMKFFKEKTSYHKIIMGRKTFESLPKLLPNREHIVLSSNNDFDEKVKVFNDFKDLLKYYENCDEEIYIIGGESIYKLFIDYASSMYLTEIDDECKNADVYFPTFNKDDWDRRVLGLNEENDITYKHVLYQRKRSQN